MKIDEHIEHIKQRKECERTNSCDECNSEICLSAELIKLLNELQWYREQDLIRREDVKNDEVLEEIALGFEREFLKAVMMIPKAEPPKEEQ